MAGQDKLGRPFALFPNRSLFGGEDRFFSIHEHKVITSASEIIPLWNIGNDHRKICSARHVLRNDFNVGHRNFDSVGKAAVDLMAVQPGASAS